MKLNDCGCCGTEGQAQPEIWNDPGLSSIKYRIDRFGGFKRSMHEAVNLKPALGRLTTRDDSDPMMSVVDAWATVLDVLTFYQERIANENYLRTATEYRSVQEFGREIGYRLAPGTAAVTYLAFKVDDTGFGPESVRVDPGTKVQSQPGQDELPQIYETLETITARPEYNKMPVREFALDRLDGGRTFAFFTGNAFDVKIGDTLLFVASGRTADATAGNEALAKVTQVTRDDNRKVTYLEWNPGLPSAISTGTTDPGPSVFIMRQRAAVFGYNAIDFSALPLTLTIGDKSPKDASFVAGPFAGKSGSWADAKLSGNEVDLESLYPSIGIDSWVVLKNSGNERLFKVSNTSEVVASRFMLTGKVTHLSLDWNGLEVFSPKDTTVLAQSEPLILDSAPIPTPEYGNKLELAMKVERPETGRKLLIVGKRPYLRFLKGGPIKDVDGTTIDTIHHKDEVRLEEAPKQDGTQLSYLILRKDGVLGTVSSNAGPVEFLPPPDDDLQTIGEVVEVAEIQTGAADDPTDIFLTQDLKYAYDRPTSVVYGNVANSSHGETKNETLGSGDASQSFQRFELKSKPLTYLASATETGYESTLTVRVNDVLWHEAPTFYSRTAKERIYTTRENEKLATEVRFGNGVTGARTETGVENITAKYRAGAGLVGRVRAGQLNMLLTRPLGVTEVINPIAATGGSDPESTVDARANIPRSALTLGRIVSVQDFEDHAARFPGIAKAQATLLWFGDHQVVYLTVSGPDAEAIDPTNLQGSIDSVRDTHFPVVIGNVERLRFGVTLEVLVKADYLADKVLPAVQNQLQDAFGFDRRVFSEAVTASQILAEVQRVEGVEAANVLTLDFVGATGDNDVLRIKSARSQGGVLMPAQILLVAPDQIKTQEMKLDV